MAKKLPKRPKRIHRELTDAERARTSAVRTEIAAELPELMAKGRAVFAAHDAARRVIAEVKAERSRQGISLADVMARSGINREAISKLENSEAPNPTIRTLVRYAAAVGLELRLSAEAPR
jgi:DNA-binding phage protein